MTLVQYHRVSGVYRSWLLRSALDWSEWFAGAGQLSLLQLLLPVAVTGDWSLRRNRDRFRPSRSDAVDPRCRLGRLTIRSFTVGGVTCAGQSTTAHLNAPARAVYW